MNEEDIFSEPVANELSGGFISETPADIADFLMEAGISDKTYTCALFRIPLEGGGEKQPLPLLDKNKYPSIEDIGKKFGPGRYTYMFSYKTPNPDGKGKYVKNVKEYKIHLGEEWQDICDEFNAEVLLKQRKKMAGMRTREEMRSIFSGEDKKNGNTDPIEDLKKTMGVLKDIGVNVGGNAPVPAQNNDMFLMMMQMQQKSTEMMMQMQTQSQNSMVQLLGTVLGANKPESNINQFQEMMQMVMGITEAKQMLNPEKKSTVDKVFELIEGVAPMFATMAMQPKEVRQANPVVGMAKNSDEYREIEKDPEMQKAIIEKLDAAHPPEQVDIIIETMGFKRPGSVQTAPEPEAEDGEFTPVEPSAL